MSSKRRHRGDALPQDALAARRGQFSSGAAGVHADQRARRAGATTATNRMGTRSARTRDALRDQGASPRSSARAGLHKAGPWSVDTTVATAA